MRFADRVAPALRLHRPQNSEREARTTPSRDCLSVSAAALVFPRSDYPRVPTPVAVKQNPILVSYFQEIGVGHSATGFEGRDGHLPRRLMPYDYGFQGNAIDGKERPMQHQSSPERILVFRTWHCSNAISRPNAFDLCATCFWRDSLTIQRACFSTLCVTAPENFGHVWFCVVAGEVMVQTARRSEPTRRWFSITHTFRSAML